MEKDTEILNDQINGKEKYTRVLNNQSVDMDKQTEFLNTQFVGAENETEYLKPQNVNMQNNIQYYNQPNTQNNIEYYSQPNVAVKKKKPNILLIVILPLLIIVLLAIAGLSVWLVNNLTKTSAVNRAVYSCVTKDGDTCIPFKQNALNLGKGISCAALTYDQKHVVVLTDDNLLYITDINLTEQKIISEGIYRVFGVCDDGFMYIDTDNIDYRYSFESGESLKLGENLDEGVDIIVMNEIDSLDIIYVYDRNIYALDHNSKKSIKLAQGSNDITNIYMGGKLGSILAWREEHGDEKTVKFLNDNDVQTFDVNKTDSEDSFMYFQATEDEKMIAIENDDSKQLWVQKAGENAIEINLGEDEKTSQLFTQDGYIFSSNTLADAFLYFSVQSGENDNVYGFDEHGDRERVLSNVKDFYIADKKIYYIDDKYDLYYADLDGHNVSNNTRISTEVHWFEVPENGGYIYFLKNCKDSLGSLYVYKTGTDRPKRIEDDVCCISVGDFVYVDIDTNEKGDTVYYLIDGGQAVDFTYNGTLKKYNYANGESVDIDTNVLGGFYMMDSYFHDGTFSDNDVYYRKNAVRNGEELLYYDLMYYNGKESTEVISGVLD